MEYAVFLYYSSRTIAIGSGCESTLPPPVYVLISVETEKCFYFYVFIFLTSIFFLIIYIVAQGASCFYIYCPFSMMLPCSTKNLHLSFLSEISTFQAYKFFDLKKIKKWKHSLFLLVPVNLT